MIKPLIYLDYNATTPVDSRVLDEMLPFFSEKFGNPSSIQHAYGWDAEEAIANARERVASLINSKPGELIFTSGATESINTVLFGVFEVGLTQNKNHIITCATEHKAVLDTCEQLEKTGARITYLPVDTDGMISLKDLEQAITKKTCLVAIMHANNETGAIHPIEEIASLAHKYGVPVFTDATQAIGKIPFDVHELNVDFAAFSGHKIYGPKGVGALFVRSGLNDKIQPRQYGGGHENGFRSGTLNVPGIVGLGKACERCEEELTNEFGRLQDLRDSLEKELLAMEGVHIQSTRVSRLPNVTNASFEHIAGDKLIRSLKGLAVSQGSACNATIAEPSHVLKAMGLSDEMAFSALRISLGRFTTREEISEAISKIQFAVERLRFQVQ